MKPFHHLRHTLLMASAAFWLSACNDNITQVITPATPPLAISTPLGNNLLLTDATPQASAERYNDYFLLSSDFLNNEKTITTIGNLVGGTRHESFYLAAKMPIVAGNYTLSTSANCQFCLFIYEDVDGGYADRIFRATAGHIRVDAVGTVWGEWKGQASNLVFSEVTSEVGTIVPGGRTLLMAAPLTWDTIYTDPDGTGPLICANLPITPTWFPYGTSDTHAFAQAPSASIGVPALSDGVIVGKEGGVGACAVGATGSCAMYLFKDLRNSTTDSGLNPRRSFIATTGTLTATRIGTKSGLDGSYSGITLRETNPDTGSMIPGGACYTLSDAAFVGSEDY